MLVLLCLYLNASQLCEAHAISVTLTIHVIDSTLTIKSVLAPVCRT